MKQVEVIDFTTHRQKIEKKSHEADELSKAIRSLIQRLRENEPLKTDAKAKVK
jgi:hypothetical protein